MSLRVLKVNVSLGLWDICIYPGSGDNLDNEKCLSGFEEKCFSRF